MSHLSHSIHMEEAYEMVGAMRRQEGRGYQKEDWLELTQAEMDSGRRPQHWEDVVDAECRDKMVNWCFQVVQFCKFSAEAVETTMSLVDRFLATPEGVEGRTDRSVYQLVCMAALYTTFKIHEQRAMTPDLVARLSNGVHTPDDIKKMEVKMLIALQWRVNPPTSFDFMGKLIELIPLDMMSSSMREIVRDLTDYQFQLAVRSHHFMTAPASIVAYVALLNSLECVGLDSSTVAYLARNLSRILQNNCDMVDVSGLQDILYQSVSKQKVSIKMSRYEKSKSHCERHPQSPRAVTHAQ